MNLFSHLKFCSIGSVFAHATGMHIGCGPVSVSVTKWLHVAS